MKITGIVLVGISNITLPIVGATVDDKYKIVSIDGLGPPQIDLGVANTLHSSAKLQLRTPERRQIVATVGLNPNYLTGEVTSDLRELLYGLLSTKPNVPITVQLMNGATVLATTLAYVSNFEPLHFVKDPQVAITLDCLDAYFVSPTLTTITTGTHQFAAITNAGSAPTGFTHTANFRLLQPSSYSNPYMAFENQDSGELMEIGILYAPLGIPSGAPTNFSDFKITIDTLAGERSVTLDNLTYPSGYTGINMLPYLSAKSQFPQLYGGSNTLIWYPGVSYVNPAITNFTTKYYPRYWGV